jgi:uncharacterized protein (DUF2141 family)
MIGHFVQRPDPRKTRLGAISAALAVAGLCGFASPVQAQYRQEIGNDPARCRSGPAVNVTVTGIKSSTGTLRVQLYRGIKQDWLATGRWLNRIEVPARAGSMTFCLPAPATGPYGVAVRHDVNNNGKTDLSQDGGGMSNNPSINIFNLGKPSYTKTVFQVGDQPASISIRMRYM